MDNFTLKPCPFCGASLIQQTGRERGGECYTYYDHPYNGCILENLSVEDYEVKAWNTRAEIEEGL